MVVAVEIVAIKAVEVMIVTINHTNIIISSSDNDNTSVRN